MVKIWQRFGFNSWYSSRLWPKLKPVKVKVNFEGQDNIMLKAKVNVRANIKLNYRVHSIFKNHIQVKGPDKF